MQMSSKRPGASSTWKRGSRLISRSHSRTRPLRLYRVQPPPPQMRELGPKLAGAGPRDRGTSEIGEAWAFATGELVVLDLLCLWVRAAVTLAQENRSAVGAAADMVGRGSWLHASKMPQGDIVTLTSGRRGSWRSGGRFPAFSSTHPARVLHDRHPAAVLFSSFCRKTSTPVACSNPLTIAQDLIRSRVSRLFWTISNRPALT